MTRSASRPQVERGTQRPCLRADDAPTWTRLAFRPLACAVAARHCGQGVSAPVMGRQCRSGWRAAVASSSRRTGARAAPT